MRLSGWSRIVCTVALACGGCGGGEVVPASELVVIVDTDALVPCELSSISIQVIGPSGPLETIERSLDDPTVELPLTLGLFQAGEQDGPVEVIAQGMLDSTVVVQRRVRTRFLPEQRLALHVPLLRACATAECELEGLTCDATGCTGIDVSPDTLSAWDGEVPPSMRVECMEEPLGGDGICPGATGDVVALPTMREAVERGSLDATSPTFARPVDPLTVPACPAEPSEGSTPYRPYVVCNAGPPRAFEIALDGECSEPGVTLFDPVLVVYAGEEIPADTTMCLALSDDDEASGCPDSRLQITLGTNEIATVVATTYDSLPEGAGTYKLTFRPL